MSQAQLLPTDHFSPSVTLHHGRPATTSLAIAEHFGKQHKDVLKSIRNLCAELPDEIRGRNFALTSRAIAGPNNSERQEEFFIVYFDGFILLVMGYTGKRALQIKLLYIAAFNAMRDELAAQREAALPEVSAPAPSPISKRSDPGRKALTAIINTWVGMAPIHYAAARAQVNAHFGVASVDALTVAQVKEAIQYVQGKIDALPPTEAELAALPAAADIDGHLAAIREHIRRIRDHEEAIFLAARKAMPLRGVGPSISLASLIHRNMENVAWSLHYALESMEASARIVVVAGRG